MSHSAHDSFANDFFHRAFSLEKVQAVYFEYEHFAPPATEPINERIASSSAMFVVLAQYAASLPHTRSWINHEAATAAALGRDVWIFEQHPPMHDLPIMQFRHYMVIWDDPQILEYLRLIIRSYDDSAMLPSLLAGGVAGGALGYQAGRSHKDRTNSTLYGTIGGSLTAVLLADRNMALVRPNGVTIRCPNVKCQRTFQMHTALPEFPCPACRQRMLVDWSILPQMMACRGGTNGRG